MNFEIDPKDIADEMKRQQENGRRAGDRDWQKRTEKIIAEQNSITENQIRRLEGLTIQVTEEDKKTKKTISKKHTPKVIFEGERLKWGNIEIPFEKGQSEVMEHVFKDRRELRGEIIIREGEPTNIKGLITLGKYGKENNFRNALAEMRKKLRENKVPVEISNLSKNYYLLVIRYPEKIVEKK